MTAKQQERLDRFAPVDPQTGRRVPKKLRLYDNGGVDNENPRTNGGHETGSIDRYTVVFTGLRIGCCAYLAMDETPFSPVGFCQHGEHHTAIDQPSYGHLGRKIRFLDLPMDCQRAVMNDYADWWKLPGDELTKGCEPASITVDSE